MKVVISHSFQDRWIARRISSDLEALGVSCFLAEKDIEARDLIEDSTRDYLRECDDLLVVVSPNSVKSQWMFLEIGAAVALGKRIVPIIVNLTMSEVPMPIGRFLMRDLNEIEKYYEELGQRSKGTPPPRRLKPNRVFISYSHVDQRWLQRVQTHLRVLQNEGLELDVWDDTRISAGDKWEAEITAALATSRIALLLISTDFLASEFIVKNELPPLLNGAEDGGTRVLPLILRPCRFTRTKNLSQFQALNDPSRPLSVLSESEQEQTLVDMTNRIEELLE